MWKERRNFRYPRKYWHRTVRLENGYKVRAEFWFVDEDRLQAGFAVTAYRGWLWLSDIREGKATGPGGTVAVTTALNLLSEAEREITRLEPRGAWLQVCGATYRLHYIYRALLRKRGYRDNKEWSGEYAPLLEKWVCNSRPNLLGCN